MTYRPEQNLLEPAASVTHPRALRRAVLVVAISLLFGICLVALAACGSDSDRSDLDRLTDEAVALMSSGRFDEALPIQERIATLDPKDAQIRVELGFNYLSHQDRPADAVMAFREAVGLEPSAKHLTFLAQAYLGSGDPLSAEKTLMEAIEADESYGHAYAVLVSLLEEQDRGAEAAELRRAAENAGVALATDSVQ